MMESIRRFTVVSIGLAALLGTLSGSLRAGEPARPPQGNGKPLDLDAPLPLDSAVRKGKLGNGLTYYIRENHKPENRLELRLVVNAGSMLEDDDQQGLAHFLEHMAFNGTRSFPATELVKTLEATGSRFGPDVNAYTSFDETVYMLEIPTDREGLVEKGFQILGEWAGAMTLDSLEVEKERGVVLEEWRLGQGAEERLRRVHWPVLFGGSRYAERLPIGKPEIIEHAPRGRLDDFYRRWYRPDLLAVIAVGSVDPDRAEALIRERFGSLAAPKHPEPRETFTVPTHPETRATAAADRETPLSQISVIYKHPRREEGTGAAYREGLIETLVSSMLNARFQENAESADAPFAGAGSGSGSFIRGVDMFRVFALAKEGKTLPALESIATEVARVRAHGFGAGELDRSKARLQAAMDRIYRERDKTESADYTGEYVGNFLENEPIPGIQAEHDLVSALLPGIGDADVRRTFDRLVHEDNRVIQLSEPEKEGTARLRAEELLAALAQVEAKTPEAYQDSADAGDLLDRPLVPGTVASRRDEPKLGATVLVLSNGVEVWLKPTAFKNDEILFAAQAKGGFSLVDSTDFPSAWFAETLVREAGVGRFTPSALRKKLSGKIAGASTDINTFTSSIQGRSTPQDLETALQYLVLTLTEPNPRKDAFATAKEKLRTFIVNREARPETHLSDRIVALNTGNHYLFRPPSLERLERVNPDQALEFHRRTFADASDYRYFFVGAFDPKGIEPLILRYLGSLTSTPGTPPGFRDPGLRFPKGTVTTTVLAGVEPKSQTRITWPALVPVEEMERFRLRMANGILEIRLRDVMREELGSTYSVGVSHSPFDPYPGYGTTSVGFGCSPENADRLIRAAFKEVATFKAEGPTPAEVETARQLELRAAETGLEENDYWLSSFLALDLLGWDFHRILARRERATAFNAAELKETFARYYPETNYTVVTLLPASPSQGAKE